jgi:formylglycine-generating enzyme
MHGNAIEWCADYWAEDYYAQSAMTNPSGPISSEKRTARGGGWGDRSMWCRSSARRGLLPDSRDYSIGFRVAMVGKLGTN